MDSNDKELKEHLSSICYTVNRYYERFDEANNYWSSVERTPAGDVERCRTMNQFIECRLNFECFFIQELTEYAKMMDGHLFDVIEVTEIDEKKRRFKECTVILHEVPDTYIGDKEYWEIHEEICKLLGPEKKLKFTWGISSSRVKIQIL